MSFSKGLDKYLLEVRKLNNMGRWATEFMHSRTTVSEHSFSVAQVGQMLALIDAGAEDIEDIGSEFEVYVAPDKLGQIHKALVAGGFEVTETELQMKPKNFVTVSDSGVAQKIMKFIDEVESHDDVQKVFTNADIPESLINNQ